jgi:hypothetical protein
MTETLASLEQNFILMFETFSSIDIRIGGSTVLHMLKLIERNPKDLDLIIRFDEYKFKEQWIVIGVMRMLGLEFHHEDTEDTPSQPIDSGFNKKFSMGAFNEMSINIIVRYGKLRNVPDYGYFGVVDNPDIPEQFKFESPANIYAEKFKLSSSLPQKKNWNKHNHDLSKLNKIVDVVLKKTYQVVPADVTIL